MKLSPRRPGGCRTTSPSGSQERFVGPEVVRALLGTLQDKQAARSVLVTTSWYGKTSWEIAHRNGQRPALIDGRNLKTLLLEHLGLDALISLPTPARLAAGRCRLKGPSPAFGTRAHAAAVSHRARHESRPERYVTSNAPCPQRRPGRIYRRCGCRDAERRQLRASCPRLAEETHGTWTFAVDIPSLSGRRRTVRRSGFEDAFEAEAALRRFLEGRQLGFDADPHETVGAYLTKWLKSMEFLLKPTTHGTGHRRVPLKRRPRDGRSTGATGSAAEHGATGVRRALPAAARPLPAGSGRLQAGPSARAGRSPAGPAPPASRLGELGQRPLIRRGPMDPPSWIRVMVTLASCTASGPATESCPLRRAFRTGESGRAGR